jgi:putative transposase
MYHAERLNHTTWDCKYHLIWIPKYRRKLLYGHLRKYLGEVFRDLSLQKESRVVEGVILCQIIIYVELNRNNGWVVMCMHRGKSRSGLYIRVRNSDRAGSLFHHGISSHAYFHRQ